MRNGSKQNLRLHRMSHNCSSVQWNLKKKILGTDSNNDHCILIVKDRAVAVFDGMSKLYLFDSNMRGKSADAIGKHEGLDWRVKMWAEQFPFWWWWSSDLWELLGWNVHWLYCRPNKVKQLKFADHIMHGLNVSHISFAVSQEFISEWDDQIDEQNEFWFDLKVLSIVFSGTEHAATQFLVLEICAHREHSRIKIDYFFQTFDRG